MDRNGGRIHEDLDVVHDEYEDLEHNVLVDGDDHDGVHRKTNGVQLAKDSNQHHTYNILEIQS